MPATPAARSQPAERGGRAKSNRPTQKFPTSEHPRTNRSGGCHHAKKKRDAPNIQRRAHTPPATPASSQNPVKTTGRKAKRNTWELNSTEQVLLTTPHRVASELHPGERPAHSFVEGNRRLEFKDLRRFLAWVFPNTLLKRGHLFIDCGRRLWRQRPCIRRRRLFERSEDDFGQPLGLTGNGRQH